MKSSINLPLLFCMALIVACNTPRQMVYFQQQGVNENNVVSNVPYENILPHYIAPGDLLSISISTPLQSSAQVLSQIDNKGGIMVKSDSTIDLPLLGKVKLAGLTIKGAKDSLYSRARIFFTEPFVNLQLLSYKVMVFGEVKLPGIKNFNNENATLIEALSFAGDLTENADRANIKIIRNDSVYYLNLLDLKITKSQGYYLQSNDIIYVQPVKKKYLLNNITTSLTFISFATSLFSLTSTIILLTRK